MSEPAAKRPSMDFDEFERRLRAPEPIPQPAGHDPLAELARLVDGHKDPYADMFRQTPRANLPGLRAIQPGESAPQVAAAPTSHQVPPVELPGAEDWQIRREEWPPSFQQQVPPAIEPPPVEAAYDTPVADEDYAPAPRKSRKGLLLMAASMAAVVAGVGATVLTRGSHHSPQDAPIIKAAQGPMKIQPEAPATSTDNTRTATILDRSGDQLGASKVVGREEQPIDISSVKSVRPAPANPPAASTTLFPEPRRVRTIPVRPDGTLAGDSGPALKATGTVAASTPAPAPTARPTTTASIAPPSLPKLAVPAASAPASTTPAQSKTTARIDPPTAAQRPAAPAKPIALAGAVVDASPPTTRGAGGNFAVQLAATSSDAEARDKAGRLASQFSAALGGRRPTVVQGEASGRSVYRIRITGLAREEATAMCGKIKGGGGACFVAH